MKIKGLALFALLFISLVPTLAQDTGLHTVSFDNISIRYADSLATNVNMIQFAGYPLASQGISSPRALQFEFYNGAIEDGNLHSVASVHVYQTADLVGYTWQEAAFHQLQTLLNDRPDLSIYETGMTGINNAPTLPTMNVVGAAQVIRGRGEYVESDTWVGIRYLTAYEQMTYPFSGTSFVYTFQGISKDGRLYLSMESPLTTALFPVEIPADLNYNDFMAGIDQYMANSVTTLNQATPDQFTPNLDDLNAFVQTITVK